MTRKYIYSLIFFFFAVIVSINAQIKEYDVVIYGATSAGITAAIQVKKMGKSVVIIEPTSHLGGLTTGGLGSTDIGNKHVIGGLSREFYHKVFESYQNPDHWPYQKRSDYLLNYSSDTTQWTFEPKVAMKIYQDWLAEFDIKVDYNERLKLDKGLVKNENSILSIVMESGNVYKAKVYIDATYEGDLMAQSGVSYTYGRESNLQYNETLNGVQTKYAIYHQFPDGVSPYVVENDPSSGLMSNMNKQVAQDGTGDQRIQAYCFRMCLTNEPENRVPFTKPDQYNESDYELLFRAIEAGYDGPFFIMSMMPNHKTDSNNKGPFSSDYIGMNFQYPEADYTTRAEIITQHVVYQKGLMWTLANHLRIPGDIRDKFSKWGYAKDEFIENDHWPPQLYVREARRMVSDFVMTEHHCRQDSITAEQSIGMGAYTMDSHHMQRYIDSSGFVKNEGDVEVGGFKPYPISYKAIVPKIEECSNLLVPVCLSASHIAFGSIRMEPVFMILGQSAATAACLAINSNLAVQNVDYTLLKDVLLSDFQILNFEE
ncbi:FAD-dependent oxidoreductase [Portibacter marinus]|uniref:FAD-dependent oxidoreductase n=1 Tax=Portibacter marinus TaxID=2898660 RepID=UPI001F2C3D0D|nr:FAD-dependent oxidoreductase [Portibacter marinus]